MNESQWSKKVWEKQIGWCTSIVANRMQRPGIPDRIWVIPHGTFFIEMKGVDTKVSQIQHKVFSDITRCGGKVIIARAINYNTTEMLCKLLWCDKEVLVCSTLELWHTLKYH